MSRQNRNNRRYLPQKCRKLFSDLKPSGPWAGRGGTAQLSSRSKVISQSHYTMRIPEPQQVRSVPFDRGGTILSRSISGQIHATVGRGCCALHRAKRSIRFTTAGPSELDKEYSTWCTFPLRSVRTMSPSRSIWRRCWVSIFFDACGNRRRRSPRSAESS